MEEKVCLTHSWRVQYTVAGMEVGTWRLVYCILHLEAKGYECPCQFPLSFSFSPGPQPVQWLRQIFSSQLNYLDPLQIWPGFVSMVILSPISWQPQQTIPILFIIVLWSLKEGLTRRALIIACWLAPKQWTGLPEYLLCTRDWKEQSFWIPTEQSNVCLWFSPILQMRNFTISRWRYFTMCWSTHSYQETELVLEPR